VKHYLKPITNVYLKETRAGNQLDGPDKDIPPAEKQEQAQAT